MSKWMKKSKKKSTVIGPLLAAVLLAVVLSLASDKFLTMTNLMNILRQSSINIIVGAGMLFCLLGAGIDLSQGSIVGFAMGMITLLHMKGLDNPFLMIALPIVVA